MAEFKDFGEYYQSVYGNDLKSESSGWIQWQGTSVCMDVHCECGYHMHVDREFFFYYECAGCGQKFAVGQIVKLIPLNEEQIKFCESNQYTFIKDEDGENG